MRFRLRADLEIVSRRENMGSTSTIAHWVHQPISGTVTRLSDEDFRGLRSSDTSTDKTGIDARLIDEASRLGLVANQPAFANPQETVPVRRWWSNPLYIKLPGIPADGIARIFANNTGWLFAPMAVACWLAVSSAVGVAVLLQLEDFWKSLVRLADFQADYWLLALGTLGITKMTHELGHAAVCRRMGARCREIGMLFLCGTPCLYCDVSESWRVPTRLGRSWIMLAGIYVEWLIASVAGCVWLMTRSTGEPTFTTMLATHVIMVCGVSTLFFNINPLMRYDGYFVLSDFLNVTNLRSSAASAWRELVAGPVAGLARPKFSVRNVAFSGYHAAARIYRYVVLIAIVGWLYLVLARCGLQPVGRFGIIVVAMMVAISQIRKWWQMISGGGFWKRAACSRRIVLATGLAGLIIGTLFVPFHHRITVAGHVDLANAKNVYMPTTATFDRMVADFGDQVSAGTLLAQLSAPELTLSREQAWGDIQKLEVMRASYLRRATEEPAVHRLMTVHEEKMQLAVETLRSVDARLDELRLIAPIAGALLPCFGSAATTPLASLENSTQEAGAAICRIGDPTKKQIVLRVDAQQQARIAVGKTVRVRIDGWETGFSGGILESRVVKVSPLMEDVGNLTTESASSPGSQRPSLSQFEVICELEDSVLEAVPVGAQVTGVFLGETTTLRQYLVDLLLGENR